VLQKEIQKPRKHPTERQHEVGRASTNNPKETKRKTTFQKRVKMAFTNMSMARSQYYVTLFTISDKIL
jgi:hypothetical protein